MTFIIQPGRRQQPQGPARLHNRWLDRGAVSAALPQGNSFYDAVQRKLFPGVFKRENSTAGAGIRLQDTEKLEILPAVDRAFPTLDNFTAVLTFQLDISNDDAGLFGTRGYVIYCYASASTYGEPYYELGVGGSSSYMNPENGEVNPSNPTTLVYTVRKVSDTTHQAILYVNGYTRFASFTSTTYPYSVPSSPLFLNTNSDESYSSSTYYQWMFLNQGISDAEAHELSLNPYSIWTSESNRRIFFVTRTPALYPTLSLPGVIDVTQTSARPKVTLTYP